MDVKSLVDMNFDVVGKFSKTMVNLVKFNDSVKGKFLVMIDDFTTDAKKDLICKIPEDYVDPFDNSIKPFDLVDGESLAFSVSSILVKKVEASGVAPKYYHSLKLANSDNTKVFHVAKEIQVNAEVLDFKIDQKYDLLTLHLPGDKFSISVNNYLYNNSIYSTRKTYEDALYKLLTGLEHNDDFDATVTEYNG